MSITERIDGITLVADKYKTETPPAPKSVKIELTGRCNYRCGFCALRMREVQPKGDMDLQFFKRITLEMRDAGVEEIGVFYLGESCMAPDLLVKAISHVKDIGIEYCFLTTNGSLMSRDLAYDCMAAGLDSMKFSINASDPEQFSKVMGVKAALFHKALSNLSSARGVRDLGKFDCGIYASSIKYDGEQHERMQELLDAYVLPYVDEHYWLPLYSMGSVAEQRERELGYKPTAGNQGRLDNMREPLPCWSAFTEGHVTSDGILSACCFDADGRWAMGDLNIETFMEAWNSDKFKELRAAHLRKDVTGTICEACVAYQ